MTDSTKKIDPEVVRLQSLMFEHRLKIGEVLNRAGVKRATWWRWTQGSEPRLSNLRKVSAAVESKAAEKAQRIASQPAPERSAPGESPETAEKDTTHGGQSRQEGAPRATTPGPAGEPADA